MLLSGILGFLFLIAITVATWNIPALTASGTPVADIVDHVLGSVVGKIFLVMVFFSIFACGLVIYITASRVDLGDVARRALPRLADPCAA